MATVLRVVLEWLAWLMMIAGAFLYELHDKAPTKYIRVIRAIRGKN